MTSLNLFMCYTVPLFLFFFAVYQLGLGEQNLRILLAGEKKKEWRSSSKREGKKRKCNEYVHYSLFKVELREYFEFDTLHCTSQWESSDVSQTNSDATKYQKMTVSVFVSSWSCICNSSICSCNSALFITKPLNFCYCFWLSLIF